MNNAKTLAADIARTLADDATRAPIFDVAEFAADCAARGGSAVHFDADENAWLVRSLNGTPVGAFYHDDVYFNANLVDA